MAETDPRQRAEALVHDALGALRSGGDPADADLPLALLADGERAAWREAADAVLEAAAAACIAEAWRRGWQPAEVVRHARRRLGPDAARLCARYVGAEQRPWTARRVPEDLHPRWAAQLNDVAAEAGGPAPRRPRWEAVESALHLLVLLERLPRLQRLLPVPGEPVHGRADTPARPSGAAPEAGKLSRIRALLAKAESTGFPEEAEALSARAAEMMARHSIDAAWLAFAESGGRSGGDAVGLRLPVEDPYADQKATLLHIVAEADGCRAVWDPSTGLSTVVGHEADTEAVEVLFTSLLVQADTAMRAAGADRDRSGRAADRRYRSSFLMAFAERVGDRLERAAASAREEAVAEHARAGRDIVPAVEQRDRAVDAAVDSLFGPLTRSRVRGPDSAEGWKAGLAAADSARLGRPPQVRR
ncbi:DUF2786 domain-containing protein [Nocardiopsis coralliicola]